ncbi:MAG: outer membrane protein insertion porin family, partial [Roseivirga sp.]
MRKLLLALAIAFVFSPISLLAQDGGINVLPGQEYEIGGIRISGSENLDKQVITLISGLEVGDLITLPGDKTTRAIENLWRQKLFDDIGIFVTELKGKVVFLEIRLRELPKLSKFGIRGLKKAKRDNLRDELDLTSGTIVTENLIVNTRNKSRDFFIKDGYLNADVKVVKRSDTTRSNSVILDILVDKGEKVKIKDINFIGNSSLSGRDLRKAMDETKRSRRWNIFKPSKLLADEYKADKKLIIEKYNSEGFRDARIISDSVYAVEDDRVTIKIKIEEGRKYYFGDINWVGNAKYTAEKLSEILAINRGDIYDASFLQQRLFGDPAGTEVSALYL